MRPVLLLTVLALLAGLALALPGSSPASAQSPEFTTTILNAYPQFLHFRLTGTAPAEVTDVSLRYRVVGSPSLARAKPEEFTPGADLDIEVRVPTGTLGFIPVGSEFLYHWEVALEDGTVLETEEENYVYLPPDEDWNSVHSDIMRVYFHGDRESIALRYLEAADRTYERMARLLQTELTIVPVITVLFASEADLEEAQPFRSEAYDAATFLCGSQVAVNVIFVIDRSCGTRDRSDTLRHEFTHIIVEAAGESALGRVPSWLNEGTAVYSQTEPGRGFTDPFEVALAVNRLIPFSVMISGNNDPSDVGLFYGQSYQMVRFLIDQGGRDDFARLFATIKAGNRFDRAIEIVYGWTIREFEAEFRAFHDLPPSEPAPVREQPASTPEPTPAPEQAEPEPTPAPTEAPEREEPEPAAATPAPRQSTADDSGRDLSNVALGAIAGAAVIALIAIFVFLLSVMLGNRGPQAAPATAGEAPPETQPSGPPASSTREGTFAASSPTEEPPPPAPELEPEPEEEPEFDEWGPRSG